MKIALTGGTGFVGRYIIQQAVEAGHQLKCWYRSEKNIEQFQHLKDHIEWVPGNLDNHGSMLDLVSGCDAVIHSAVWKPGTKFQGEEGDLVRYSSINMVGSLALIEAAREADVPRFIFLSSGAVHDRILEDRLLDEKHPLWPQSHYGAYKAAVEKFVHSFGFGHGYDICALRPTAVYGLHSPITKSKHFELVQQIVQGTPITVNKGSKEVHVADVAKAAVLLLTAENIAGESFNCYDRYISEFEVAELAKQISGSSSEISGIQKQPKNQIDTGKLRSLGMEFGGELLFKETVASLVKAAQASLETESE